MIIAEESQLLSQEISDSKIDQFDYFHSQKEKEEKRKKEMTSETDVN